MRLHLERERRARGYVRGQSVKSFHGCESRSGLWDLVDLREWRDRFPVRLALQASLVILSTPFAHRDFGTEISSVRGLAILFNGEFTHLTSLCVASDSVECCDGMSVGLTVRGASGCRAKPHSPC